MGVRDDSIVRYLGYPNKRLRDSGNVIDREACEVPSAEATVISGTPAPILRTCTKEMLGACGIE